MLKKRKRLIVIILVVIMIFITIFAVLFIKYTPYIHAATIAKQLINGDYSYNMECYIEGVTFKDGKHGKYTVYAQGEKYQDSIRGYVYSDETPYLEVWGDVDGEVIFNVKPMCEFISEQIENVMGLTIGDLNINMDDTYISLEQIEDIIGKDIISMDDFGVEKISSDKISDYDIELVDMPDGINVDYDIADSYFFRLTLSDYDTKVIIGVPKVQEDDFLYVNMEKDDIKLEICFSYDTSESYKVVFPKETFSDEYIATFEKFYKLWLLAKTAYEKAD